MKAFRNCPNGRTAYEDTSIEKYLWKISNESKSMWYLNQDHALSFPLQLSEVGIPLQTGVTRKIEFPLSPEPRQRAFFLEGAGCQHFSSCPKCLAAEARSQVSATEKKGPLSCAQPPMYNGGSTETRITLSLAHGAMVEHQKRQAKRTPGFCSLLPGVLSS